MNSDDSDRLEDESLKAARLASRAVIEAITGALRALPPRASITEEDYEREVFWATRMLIKHRVNPSDDEARSIRDYIRYGHEEAVRARRQIRRLLTRVAAAANYLETTVFQPATLFAFAEVGLISSESDKDELLDCLRHMEARLEKAHALAPGPGAKPYASRAQEVARHAYSIYFRITGVPPTRRYDGVGSKSLSDGKRAYGPYIELLGVVFAALGITASADNNARAAIEHYGEKPSAPG